MPHATKRIRDLFTVPSRLHYLLWQTLGRRWAVRLRLRHGPAVLIRAAPKTDFWVVVQVFLDREYQLPASLGNMEVRRVLDLGSNVGYTLLHWAWAFPRAHITGYEPVAAHCTQARAHLRINGLTLRVDIREAAVGARAATAYISDRGSDSAIVSEPGVGTEQIAVVDLFDEVAAGSVDLLKMDIEGGEYALVADERFGRLGARQIVLEWHEWRDNPGQTRNWLVERLESCGYHVREVRPPQQVGDNLRVGMLWASLTHA